MSDTQSARWREGTEWYTCDRCGTHYPRRLVAVQNGRVRCKGSGTHNCWENPGYQASLKNIDIGYEATPEPLPSSDEDL
jgi:hypothetical protein